MKQFKQKFRCVRSVQIRSFFWSVFSRIQSICGKYGSEKTPYLNTFHVVGWFFNCKKLVAVLPIVTLWNSEKHVVVENVYHVT